MNDAKFFSHNYNMFDSILYKNNDLIKLKSNLGGENFDHLLWLWIREVWMSCSKTLIDGDLKKHMIQDLMETLWKREGCFDKIHLFLVFPCIIENECIPNDEILWEILSYASIAGMKFWNFKNETREKPIDFPIQEDNMYGCSECMRPLQIAASNGHPYAVHRLLNLGARVRDDDACPCPLLNDAHPILRLINVPGCRVKFLERSETETYNGAIACYNMILADTPYYSTTWKRIHKALQQYSNDVVDGNIPSLKYIIRFHIRRILIRNNSICYPNVWEMLGLPDILISYMQISGYVYDADGVEVIDKYRPHILV